MMGSVVSPVTQCKKSDRTTNSQHLEGTKGFFSVLFLYHMILFPFRQLKNGAHNRDTILILCHGKTNTEQHPEFGPNIQQSAGSTPGQRGDDLTQE